MATKVDIAIIGAGAAGLAAGIFAAQTRPDLTIILLDGAKSIGAKILVSGGGRCNVTNTQVTPADFHGSSRIIGKILQQFTEESTVSWLESLGVPLKTETTGKLFPVTNKARTVLNALLRRCSELGIQINTQHHVQQISPTDTGFRIVYESGHLPARKVILAAGGHSLPKTGSDGHGWTIAQQLGHTATLPYPALVPLILDKWFFHKDLSGISHDATLTTRVNGKVVDQRTGSLLWTHFGISGPVVLDASRFWVIAHGQGRPVTLTLNVFPDQSFDTVDRWLSNAGTQEGRQTVSGLLSKLLPTRLAKTLCSYVENRLLETTQRAAPQENSPNLGSTRFAELSRLHRRALTQALTNLPLPVVDSRGWNFAEVTAGGIPLKEIYPSSMASRKAPGLYIIGEMLDCDGRIGGFNFQWAWSTGYISGCQAAESLG